MAQLTVLKYLSKKQTRHVTSFNHGWFAKHLITFNVNKR